MIVVNNGIQLADLVTPRTEKTNPCDAHGVPYIGLDNVEAHSTRLIGSKDAATMKSSAKSFHKGDVLYSRLRPYLNKVWLADRNDLCSAEFIVLPQNQWIDGTFLKYRLNSRDFVTFANSLNAGDRPRVDFDQISSFILPPFSLAYQRRIVAKIEELFSELDDGIASLKTARAQLKIYRQALLKHAFEGKLTESWRKTHADSLESADQLLARIAKEREAYYQKQIKDWKQAVDAWESAGMKGKSPSRPSKLKAGSSKLSNYDGLPRSWKTLALDDLAAESVLGKMLDQTKNQGTPRPYLGNINVRWGVFDLRNLKTMRIEDSEVLRYQLKEHDLVVCEGGEPGRCAIWKTPEKEVYIQKALHRVRFTKSYDSNFAYHYLAYASHTNRLADYFTGTTIKHLTGAGLGKITFPLCSISEQREIVSLLDEKLSAVDRAENEIELNLQRAEALRQSILKKAFSGQLVAQDPADEPASVLLERIRAGREAGASVSKAKKKPARSRG